MDRFFKHLGIGFGAYAKALKLIFSNGLGYFFLFPLALNVILFFGGFLLIGNLTGWVEGVVTDFLNLDDLNFWGGDYIEGALSGFIWIFFKIMFFFLFAFVGGYIVIVLLSPVYAFLSEKTDEILTGNVYPFVLDQFVRDIWRGILIAVRNMLVGLLYMVIIFLLGFIPIVGQLGGIVLFFITAYFYGFSFIDYTNERKKRSIRESIHFMRRYKGMAVGNGLVFSVLMLVPFCGYLLAGFGSIVSVVAATIAAHEVEESSKDNFIKSE